MLFAARDLSCALRLCSDRGHPGGQESGERSECHELNRLGSPQRRRSPAVPEIGDDSWPERLPTFTRRSAMSSSWPGPRPYLRRVGDVHWRRASYEERRRPLLVHARIGKRCSNRRCSAGEVLEGWSEFIRSARARSCKHRRRWVPPQLQRVARRSHTRGAWIPARAAATASVTTVGSAF